MTEIDGNKGLPCRARYGHASTAPRSNVSGKLPLDRTLLSTPVLVRRGLLHRGKTSFGMLKRMRRSCRVRPVLPPRSAFAGFRFPREVIVLAVRWYLRYGLSIAMLKSCWPNVECRSTTSVFSGGCSTSRRC